MIDKTAGLPTQIRQLEKRLKEMDASKVKPALVKEITDTIKNLKDMLKEKQEKREQRKKEKESKVQEVEAANPAAPGQIGAVAPNAVTTTQPGQPEATPTTPDDQKVSCPLCGGMTFNDQASYQQHMEFTHASDTMPTAPGQKLDKTVAAIEPTPIPSTPEAAPAPAAEQGPQFKLDDEVKPIRGGDSRGKVMRWDGKPNDSVYVMWESGPLKERDGFGGYYPLDLEAVEQPVEAVAAPAPVEEPVCEKCTAMQQKHGDLKSNYEALLKDLIEERDAHYAQGNHSWTARLDQKIVDLEKAIAEKFGDVPPTTQLPLERYDPKDLLGLPEEKKASGGPELIRQINRATSGHGYEATVYDLTNGRFQQHVPLKINETNVRMKQPENGTFELKYSGMPEWRPVLQPEFDQWLAEWKLINEKNNQKEGAAENAKDLTIMDHTPPRANSGPDAGGTDTHDEFQDEWAMPVTSEVKLNVFKRELLATPTKEGYDISHEGKKLFNIKGKENKPMNKKQLEFCAQIEFTRGMKQAKLVEKIASLDAGSTVFVMAEDKTTRRVKFASLEHGFRGWAPISKFAFLVKEGQMMQHKDHIDNTYGSAKNGGQMLCDCPNGSGNIVWNGLGELLPINPPPATPESLNDLESAKARVCDKCKKGHYKETEDAGAHWFKCDKCGFRMSVPKNAAKECPDCHGTFEGAEGEKCPTCGRFAVQKTALETALPKQILPQRGDVNTVDPMNGPSDEDVQQKAWELFKQHWDGLSSEQMDEVYRQLGVTASLRKIARVVHREDGWHVLSEKGKNLGGPYKSKGEAVKRLRQVEYFKHHGAVRPFSRQVIAEVLADPYQSLTDHITDMRSRMTEVQDRIQTAPAIKTAGEETPMNLPALFEDITHGIALLENDLGRDKDSDPTVHKMIEELENKLWKLEEECGITPKLDEHEKAEPEHKEIVEDIEKEAAGETMATKCRCMHLYKDHMDNDECSFESCDCKKFHKTASTEKQADQVTDETIVTNDPNAVIDPNNPAVPPAPTIQNVQPTDQDNLEVPVAKPTSPPAPGQIWVYNPDVKAYVSMPDPNNPGKTI